MTGTVLNVSDVISQVFGNVLFVLVFVKPANRSTHQLKWQLVELEFTQAVIHQGIKKVVVNFLLVVKAEQFAKVYFLLHRVLNQMALLLWNVENVAKVKQRFRILQ